MINNEFSVAEKINTAIHFLRGENPRAPLTVSAICRLAKVNRSSLYEHHPDLIEKIRESRRKDAVPKESLANQNKQRDRLQKDHVKRNRALLYLCLELKAELDATRSAQPCSRAKQK